MSQKMQYFIWLDGLPRHLRWKSLKDLVRRADKQIRWTDIPLLPSGESRGHGCCRGDGEDVGWRVYDFLRTYSSRLTLHLFDITDRHGQAQLLACNCRLRHSALMDHGLGADLTNSVAQSWLAEHSTVPYPPATYDYPISPLSMTPVGTVYVPTASLYISGIATPLAQPLYATDTNGVPVNASHGTVHTEARSVLVARLCFRATSLDVERFLRQVAEPRRCEVRRNGGTATASFATAVDAERVVTELNGRKLMGRAVEIRLDKNQTTVSRSPIVANGSLLHRRT